jgi:hypothetical protein
MELLPRHQLLRRRIDPSSREDTRLANLSFSGIGRTRWIWLRSDPLKAMSGDSLLILATKAIDDFNRDDRACS